MSAPFRKSLSTKLAFRSVLIALILGIVASFIQIAFDFYTQNRNIDLEIDRMLTSTKVTANQAAFELSPRLASKVVGGLMVYDYIIEANIIDDVGRILAQQKRSDIANNRTRWIDFLISEQYSTHSTALLDEYDTKNNVAKLEIEVDRIKALSAFFERSFLVISAGLFRNMVLTVALILFFQFYLTSPLLKMIRSLREINPLNPRGERLSDELHHDNELSEMTNAINRFISETEKDKTELKSSIKEKEILLQEIHHRVKNNLQVVNSLINLQLKRTKNSEVSDVLIKSKSRIQAMASVHESLYNSENLSSIELKEYINGLAKSVLKSYQPHEGNIAIEIDCERVFLDISQASPLGLSITELLSNSLKYAFSNQEKGIIKISVNKIKGDLLKVIIKDNGTGFPEGFNWRETETFGLTLVKNLIENQLNGSVELLSDEGSSFTLSFNIEKTNE